jgi:hypothetical protein
MCQLFFPTMHHMLHLCLGIKNLLFEMSLDVVLQTCEICVAS